MSDQPMQGLVDVLPRLRTDRNFCNGWFADAHEALLAILGLYEGRTPTRQPLPQPGSEPNDDTIIATLPLSLFRERLSERGVDTGNLSTEDVEGLRQIALEEPQYDLHVYRAARCVADAYVASATHLNAEEEADLLEMMLRTFDPDDTDEQEDES